jgi:uncharacterized protein involved in outer membrane biogenesis
MKKILITTAALLVIVIAGVAVYFYNNVDAIVKNAIERSGTDITGTGVDVGSVDISLRSGRGTIRNVRVENPDGFSDADAVTLGEITLDLDVMSLNRDPIIIEEIRVRMPEVNAEVDEILRTNVAMIRDHVQQYGARSAKPAQKQDAGYEKHFVIKSFVMEEGVVRGDATRLRQRKGEYELPPIELSNVGGSRGARPEVIGKAIAAALFARVSQVVGDQIRATATEKATEKAKEELEKILNP